MALRGGAGEVIAGFAEGDAGGGFEGVAVDAGGDAGEGDGAAGVFGGEGEGVAVAGGELFGFAVGAAAPDGADGVDDVLRGQAEAGRDAGFAGRAADAEGSLGQGKAGFQEFLPGGSVDGTIDAATAEEVVADLGAKVIIPMHFSTPWCSFPIAPVEDFTNRILNVVRLGVTRFEPTDIPASPSVLVLEPSHVLK